MSLSKEQQITAEAPRRPTCSRCRHHGIIVAQKGHYKRCPFSNCHCWKCHLITQRTQLTAIQRSLERPQHRSQRPGFRSVVRPEAQKTSGGRAGFMTGEAGPSAAGSPTTMDAWSPHDARGRLPRGGERVAGQPLPPNMAEEGPFTPFGKFNNNPILLCLYDDFINNKTD